MSISKKPTKLKKYKIARRLGAGVFEKTQTQKFLLVENKGRQRRQNRPTDYGTQMIEKQKVRVTYGLRERQFRNYVKAAMEHAKHGVSPSDLLSQSLERRLDNTVARLGFASTRRLARQMVSHGHITVNGKKVSVPSYHTREGDIIAIRPGSQGSALFRDLAIKLKNWKLPEWLAWDKETAGKIIGNPKYAEGFLNFQTVIEFYSR